jgi:hypothetical protein
VIGSGVVSLLNILEGVGSNLDAMSILQDYIIIVCLPKVAYHMWAYVPVP